MRYLPEGLRLTRRGVERERASKRARGSGTWARPARATRWMIALVEPPMAMSLRIALSKACAVRRSEGRGPPACAGARAELLGAPGAAQHGAAGDHDRGDIGGGGAHEHGRGGLVAAGEEDDGVERIRADALLDVHGHEVPEEHGRRLHEDLAERDGRELDGKAPSAPDAPLDGVRHLSQVRITVGELGPRVGDADHGPAVEDDVAEPLGLEPRAMNEAVEVVAPEPVAAPERVCCHGNPPDHRL